MRKDAVKNAVKFIVKLAEATLCDVPLDTVETANIMTALINYIIELEEVLKENDIELPE